MRLFIQPGNFSVLSKSITDDNSQYCCKINQGKKELAIYVINSSELPHKANPLTYNAELAGLVAFNRFQSQHCSN